MISNGSYNEAFVWIWLPGETDPVVAGKLTAEGDRLVFNYGKSYLARDNAIALYDPELPLQAGIIPLLPGLSMPGCIRDASPDAWGRRVLINKEFGLKGANANATTVSETANHLLFSMPSSFFYWVEDTFEKNRRFMATARESVFFSTGDTLFQHDISAPYRRAAPCGRASHSTGGTSGNSFQTPNQFNM